MPHVRRLQNVTVIELDAQYDALDQELFNGTRDLLLAEAQSANPPKVVLDLSRTIYMGSAFLEVIFRAWKRLRERGGRLAMCCVQPFCADVLRIARLDGLWETHDTLDDALAAMGEAPPAT